jgi:hypothetical protein
MAWKRAGERAAARRRDGSRWHEYRAHRERHLRPRHDNPSQYDCHKVYPFLTDIRGMAIYTMPKFNVQLSGTLQSRPGPEILAQWNVPASVIAQSLGRVPSGGVANIQTNILTAGE